MTGAELVRRGVWKPADVVVVKQRGFPSDFIGFFQGRDGHAPSHVALMTGIADMAAEATVPRGGIASAAKWVNPKADLVVYRVPHWTDYQRVRIATAAIYLSKGRYDYLNIARHLADNIFARLGMTHVFAHWIKDSDRYRRNVCSELAEWAIHFGTSTYTSETLKLLTDRKRYLPPSDGEKLQDGAVGQAIPLDVVSYCIHKQAEPLVTFQSGKLTDVSPHFSHK